MAKRKANIVSLAERRYAQTFLKALRVDWTDNNLIYAVVAWMRVMSGSLGGARVHNPFLLGANSIAARFAIGSRRIRVNGKLESVLVFKTMEAGFRAAAYVLLHTPHTIASMGSFPLDLGNPYQLAINAMKNGRGADFLVALAMSAWSIDHFGVIADPTDPKQNRLLAMYLSFTGMTLPAPPPKKVKKTRQVMVPVRPGPPPVPVKRLDYLHAWDARDFYNARHHPVKPLSGAIGPNML